MICVPRAERFALVFASVAGLAVMGCSSNGKEAVGGTGGLGVSAATGGATGSSGGTTTPGTGGRVGGGGVAGGGSGGAMPNGGAPGMGGGLAPGTGGTAVVDGGVTNPFGGGPVATSAQHLDISVHDPSMIWDGSRYYLFATGGTLNIRSSADGLQWASVGKVFATQPAWIATALGAAPSGLWAPDVSYFAGAFHVYYAGSTFGSQVSVIGLATSPTLDPASPSYRWTDVGEVVRSMRGSTYNAIDPNVAFDDSGTPWLSFGSFWDGIKMRKLDPATGLPAAEDPTLYSLASRGGGAIEAPSIVAHGGYYYLFVSFDACCQNVNSTYRTMAGRATKITGPYADSAGRAMLQSGGDQLLATSGRYIGPGGGTAWKNGDNYQYAFHYYDGQANGASKLQVRPIQFTADGWMTLGDPLFP
jgi:arabinan endo-1,5-alpha-L-arabinosidase